MSEHTDLCYLASIGGDLPQAKAEIVESAIGEISRLRQQGSEGVVVEVFETDGTADCTLTAGGRTISIPCQFAAILGNGTHRLTRV